MGHFAVKNKLKFRFFDLRRNKLHKNISDELNKASQDWTKQSQEYDINERDKFNRLFKELWSDLASALQDLLYDIDAEQESENSQDDSFKEQTEVVIDKCREDSGLPQIEDIKKRKADIGDWPSTFYRYLHDIRTHLTKHFEAMDTGLNNSVEQVKSCMAKSDPSTKPRGRPRSGPIGHA